MKIRTDNIFMQRGRWVLQNVFQEDKSEKQKELKNMRNQKLRCETCFYWKGVCNNTKSKWVGKTLPGATMACPEWEETIKKQKA